MRSQHHLWVMRLVACALLSGCSARVEDTLNLLNTCPNGPDACLEMDLGLANPADERLIGQELLPGGRVIIDIMRGEFTQPYQGYDIFTLRVRGRLAGGQTQTYDLRFQSGNEMGCTIFGDSFVAVAGFSGTKKPLFLTDRGILEIAEPSLTAGCKGCILLIDKETLATKEFISTSWQRRTLLTYSLTIDAQQNLFFGSGDQCVALKDDDRFRRVEPENCAPTAYRPASRDVIRRVQEIGAVKDPHYAERLQYDLLEPDGLPFYIYEYGVACT